MLVVNKMELRLVLIFVIEIMIGIGLSGLYGISTTAIFGATRNLSTPTTFAVTQTFTATSTKS